MFVCRKRLHRRTRQQHDLRSFLQETCGCAVLLQMHRMSRALTPASRVIEWRINFLALFGRPDFCEMRDVAVARSLPRHVLSISFRVLSSCVRRHGPVHRPLFCLEESKPSVALTRYFRRQLSLGSGSARHTGDHHPHATNAAVFARSRPKEREAQRQDRENGNDNGRRDGPDQVAPSPARRIGGFTVCDGPFDGSRRRKLSRSRSRQCGDRTEEIVDVHRLDEVTVEAGAA